MSGGQRILGAVIAGGRSRRFGGDKALANIDGQPMIAHVIAALRPQVDDIVICGRHWLDFEYLFDRRHEWSGPLSGLEAALNYAIQNDFDAVISVPVDTLPLPSDLVKRLSGEHPAVFDLQYLIGYWPISFLALLEQELASGKLSVRSWICKTSARRVAAPFTMINVNYQIDLAQTVTIPRT
jgi:molybdopterin-guanine dinucleotide biosynthesis protein A